MPTGAIATKTTPSRQSDKGVADMPASETPFIFLKITQVQEKSYALLQDIL